MRFFIFLINLLLVASCTWEETTSNTTKTVAPTKEATARNSTTPNTTTIKKSVATAPPVPAKYLCIPGKQVGLITSASTEAAIQKAYGKKNVVRRTIGLGEGETTEGTVVFPDTDNELIIEWAAGKTYQQPATIRIEKTKGTWTTNQGIRVGTSLDQLQTINGKDFKFAGFEWDYAGIAKDWQGGKISKQLTVFLEATKPDALYPDLLGDALFPSSHPKAKAADLKVRSMVIALN